MAVALAIGAGACAKSVPGQALAVTSVAAPATTSTGKPTGSGSPTSGNNAMSQQARQVCGQLPKGAVTQAFGVQQITVTTDSGTTLAGGIQQVKCVVTAENNFRVNVVIQVYPAGLLSTAQQYAQIMGHQFTVTPLSGITGADAAGSFQQTLSGTKVDEAFAARKDSATNTVDVVLAGLADSPGIMTKLATFLTALVTA
jgi:hypothetical protein